MIHKDSLHKKGRLEAAYMREACVRSAQLQAAEIQTEVDYKLDSQHKSSKYPVILTDTDLEYRTTYLLGRGDRYNGPRSRRFHTRAYPCCRSEKYTLL